MKRIACLIAFLSAANGSFAAPIATAESFGYSGQSAMTYNRMVASLASANCAKLNEVASQPVQASAESEAAIRQNAARAEANPKGC